MYSEQLAILLLMAAAHTPGPQARPPQVPFADDPRHGVIQAVREPELVAALSLRAKRPGLRVPPPIATKTLFASLNSSAQANVR